MFQYHKYNCKDFDNKNKTNCPVCNTDINFPKSVLILFLSCFGFVFFVFLSIFNDNFWIIATISAMTALVLLPFVVIEANKHKNEIQDGYRTLNYLNKIESNHLRKQDFKSYGYVCGLQNDNDIKNIMIEVHKDGLNIYHKKMKDIITVNYSNIIGLELQSDINIKQSTTKSLIYGIALSALGGFKTGILGAALGGIKLKSCII